MPEDATVVQPESVACVPDPKKPFTDPEMAKAASKKGLAARRLKKLLADVPPRLMDMRFIYAGSIPQTESQKSFAKMYADDFPAFMAMLNQLERAHKPAVGEVAETAQVVPVEALPEDEGSERALKCLGEWLKEYGSE